MRKLALFIVCFFICQSVYAQVLTYSINDKFGLSDDKGNIITEAIYKKLIRLGDTAWIMQKGNKYGIIQDNGKILVEPIYTKAERVLGKYVKFSKGDKIGVFDEIGFDILPVKYSSIDLLYGGMFVTSINYKYGIVDLNGKILLDNIFDDIYMPDFETLVLIYNGSKVEIKRKPKSELTLDNIPFSGDLSKLTLTDIVSSPIASTGYYSVTFTDYILKLFSSISPAYEQTIEELMFSQGADTVSIFVKCSWIPKFPFVYAKKYAKNYANPYSGPLSFIKKI